ncbi:hypothetical protein ES703_122112 [subsurface metagenome]
MLKKLKNALRDKKPSQETPLTPEKETTPIQKTPLRSHYTQTEIEMIQNLVDEGNTNREIASKMNRTIPGIKALKRKMGLTQKIKAELPALTSRRDALADEILQLRINISLESTRLDGLKKETAEHEELKKRIEYYRTHENEIKRKLQAFIRTEADAVAINKILGWLKR